MGPARPKMREVQSVSDPEYDDMYVFLYSSKHKKYIFLSRYFDWDYDELPSEDQKKLDDLGYRDYMSFYDWGCDHLEDDHGCDISLFKQAAKEFSVDEDDIKTVSFSDYPMIRILVDKTSEEYKKRKEKYEAYLADLATAQKEHRVASLRWQLHQTEKQIEFLKEQIAEETENE